MRLPSPTRTTGCVFNHTCGRKACSHLRRGRRSHYLPTGLGSADCASTAKGFRNGLQSSSSPPERRIVAVGGAETSAACLLW